MNRFSFLSLITATLVAIIGMCATVPQHAHAETSTPQIEVHKQGIRTESWKEVRYEDWIIYIPTNTEKRCEKWEPMLKKQGLPVKIFSYLMWRESRCQAKAIGWNYKQGKNHKDCSPAPFDQYRKCRAVRSYDSGLMQVNSSWVTVTSNICRSDWGNMKVLRKPECNLKVSRYLLDNGGLGHWGAKKVK
jgi:hypothetical protein